MHAAEIKTLLSWNLKSWLAVVRDVLEPEVELGLGLVSSKLHAKRVDANNALLLLCLYEQLHSRFYLEPSRSLARLALLALLLITISYLLLQRPQPPTQPVARPLS